MMRVEFMNTVFMVMFGVGVGYSVIAFLLGETINAIDVDADFAVGGTISPFKPVVIAAFITVYGGSGLIFAQTPVPMAVAIPASGVIAAAVAFVIYRFVVVPLSKAANTTAIEIQSLIGHPAKVTVKIPQGQFGRITYLVNGSTYSAPAKAEDGGEIGMHAPVEIVYIEKNTYFVRQSA
jgi:membrane protein implicated in regulation of membrane protease activity